MCDLDINVCLLEGLGLESLPYQFARGGFGVKTHPSLEFVVLSRHVRCQEISTKQRDVFEENMSG
jgi:hypothetical protein